MARHLKTIVMDRLRSTIATFEDLPTTSRRDIRRRRHSGPHARGVRYFSACTGIDMIWGAMDYVAEGKKYKKRIIVRPSRFRDGLFELYTYHFPKHWSAACIANRELIKEAQRQAHALEHSSTPEALEWRIRFFRHYYNVVKGHAAPEPGMKRYSRFYQYTYVAIYRELRAEAAETAESKEQQPIPASAITDAYLRHLTEEVTFEPIKVCSFQGNSIARSRYRSIFRSFSPPLKGRSGGVSNGIRLPISVST